VGKTLEPEKDGKAIDEALELGLVEMEPALESEIPAPV
jgi:hypothetical protein